MKEYETIFVIRPDGSESQTKQLLEKVDGIITRHGGTILKQNNWGKRDLAYHVQKYSQGIYFCYNYAGGGGLVAELERTLRLHELPMKFLTVKLSDEVDIEARKNELMNEKEPTDNLKEPAKDVAGDVDAGRDSEEVLDV